MGVSIHYRGSFAEIDRIEDFEDRVIDLVLAIGGNVRLWRSADDNDRSRMVRGLFVDLAPGQETTSLLISPEGWLIHFVQIEDAEKGLLGEPPWCAVKTQFGSIEGHVALVELLDALKQEFMPNLEVSDEGGYWENRDVNELRRKIDFLNHAMDVFSQALENDRLSPEAREDPDILATRIERLARKVHETIGRPAEHAPVEFPDEETGAAPNPQENEARWDELFNENRRKQERMERVMEEQILRGQSTEDAFRAALDEVVPSMDWADEDDDDADDEDDEVGEFGSENSAFAAEPAETWQASDIEASFEDLADPLDAAADEVRDHFDQMTRHPLQKQATDLLISFHQLAERNNERSPSIDLLMRNAMEITGGLAQVLPVPPTYELSDIDTGLSLVQLKRALRGAAFVRGALFLLRGEKMLEDAESRAYHEQIDVISKQIVELIRTVREAGK